MPARPLTMHQIEEILRLYAAHLSQPQIARALCLSLGVVNKYLQAARRAKLSWPLPAELTAEQLQQRLFPVAQSLTLLPKEMPDFARVHLELKQKGVTRLLLWEEYAAEHPQQHYSYSRFTELYQDYRRRLRVTLRQTHRAGEKLFVDYAGPTVDIIDGGTGEVRAAQIFVALLGASNYTYVEATWAQSPPDWCGSHVRAFEFFGGVPEIVVPEPLPTSATPSTPLPSHTYIRGAVYYQQLLQGEAPDVDPTDTRHLTHAKTARHGASLPTTTGAGALKAGEVVQTSGLKAVKLEQMSQLVTTLSRDIARRAEQALTLRY